MPQCPYCGHHCKTDRGLTQHIERTAACRQAQTSTVGSQIGANTLQETTEGYKLKEGKMEAHGPPLEDTAGTTGTGQPRNTSRKPMRSSTRLQKKGTWLTHPEAWRLQKRKISFLVVRKPVPRRGKLEIHPVPLSLRTRKPMPPCWKISASTATPMTPNLKLWIPTSPNPSS